MSGRFIRPRSLPHARYGPNVNGAVDQTYRLYTLTSRHEESLPIASRMVTLPEKKWQGDYQKLQKQKEAGWRCSTVQNIR